MRAVGEILTHDIVERTWKHDILWSLLQLSASVRYTVHDLDILFVIRSVELELGSTDQLKAYCKWKAHIFRAPYEGLMSCIVCTDLGPHTEHQRYMLLSLLCVAVYTAGLGVCVERVWSLSLVPLLTRRPCLLWICVMMNGFVWSNQL
jgi:hypothetical protein